MSTTLVNALLELGSNGQKALHAFNPSLHITTVQTAICAPWSHTVTKSIQYEKEHPFTVDQKLVSDLVAGTAKKLMETTFNGELLDAQGLEIVHEVTAGIELNGYFVRKPFGQTARTVSLAQITEVAERKLLITLKDSIAKILPKTSLEVYSFMYLYYQTLRELHPDTSEICLIDVTNEATEIGIVRDDILRYVSHIPIGTFTLAREISRVTGVPKEEAYTVLKENGADISSLSEEKKKAVKTVFSEYQEELSAMFRHTGDTLSIPKTLFLHTERTTEAFFGEQLKQAAKIATNSEHMVHLFTSELLGDKQLLDTALALSIHHFHVRELYSTISL
jgi:cell division ATPase FtsA